MEAVKRRSESPVTKSKTKGQLSDVVENGDSPADLVKAKRKNQKNKKSLLGENGELQKNGTELQKEEITSNQTDKDQDDLNEADENKENDQGNDSSKENIPQVVEEVRQENGSTDESNETFQDTPINESNGYEQKTSDEKELTNETESSAKTSNGVMEDDAAATPGNEDLDNEANGINLSTEVNIEEVSYLESTQNGELNASDDGSHYEDAQTKEDHIQASPDTATKDESLSNKISSFLGKWTPQQETKQDFGITSSQTNGDGPTLIHPYLSKVSGRRGIKENMNSTVSSFNSKDEEVKTPTNLSTNLDDSFRVRTNPTRLNASEIEVNSNLRKFKGKRCLNANDESEDGDEVYLASAKRRKTEDKAEDSGLLSNILWSPFRKKTGKSGNAIKSINAESKLSRFLSPFWFWKKTAVVQKGK